MKFIKVTIFSTIFLASLGLFNVADAATEVVRTIKPSGQGGDYTSLTAWEAGERRDLVATDEIAVAQIDGNWSTPDTTSITIDGWTTDATRYIKIYTTEQARHGGKWDNEKYRLVGQAWIDALIINESYTIIDGLQIITNSSLDSEASVVSLNSGSGGSAISNSIIRNGALARTNTYGISINWQLNANLYIYNNIIYDFIATGAMGIRAGAENSSREYIYNNTFINCYIGLSGTGTARVLAINNLFRSCTTAAAGTYLAGTDYNATDNSSMDYTVTGGGNTHDRISQTFTFASESNDDFHLNSTDTGAKNWGVDLTNDVNLPFNSDIDGYVRNQVWDIGADEVGGNTRVIFSPDPGQETNFGAATAIYRSVGPSNTTALAVGTSNTLTISGSTATFSSPLPDRIGVGDALQYDDDNDSDIDVNDSIVFIHSRTDSKTFTVKTASGGSPTSIASDNNWSIFRAYTSLSLAEAGTENTGIDADLRAFDTFSGGKDIATSNEVWNIAAYGDAPDTTAVTINGWTTDADNYIRIYTPVSKQEVGVSQRHRGKWDEGKYRLEISAGGGAISGIAINEEYIRIDGFQIYITNNGYSYVDAIASNSLGINNDIYISNNVLKGTITTSRSNGFIGYSGNEKVKIWNNIAYDFNTGSAGEGFRLGNAGGGPYYVYNNTAYGNYNGFFGQSGTVIVKNNLASGSIASDFSGDFDANSSHNSSEDATADDDIDSINTRINQNFSFTNPSAKDFHLSSFDTGAKDFGTDLTNDANLPFNTDIDGQSRSGGWDIGADERPANTVIKGGVRITK